MKPTTPNEKGNMRLQAYLLICSLYFALVGTADRTEPLELTIGPEQMMLPGGLQPFMFQSGKGILAILEAFDRLI